MDARIKHVQFVVILPLVNIMESELVKVVKVSLNELYKEELNMFAWLIEIVQWTNEDGIVVNFADFRNV